MQSNNYQSQAKELKHFRQLKEDIEPLDDSQFSLLPGNLKKSYLMMEIQEDKL